MRRHYFKLLQNICKYKDQLYCSILHKRCNMEECPVLELFVFDIGNVNISDLEDEGNKSENY